jgi:hypothetical protein
LIERPSISLAITTPHRNDGTTLPRNDIQSQKSRHRCWSTWLRYSNDTPRSSRASRITTNTGYMPLNSAPYQTGKVENMTPAAAITHTSLPSQNGPMVPVSARSSASVLASSGRRMSTPKSKPSRKK